jgi:hypothetical protein
MQRMRGASIAFTVTCALMATGCGAPARIVQPTTAATLATGSAASPYPTAEARLLAFVGTAKASDPSGRWQKSTDKSKMDDKQTCTTSLQAKSKVQGWLRNGDAHLVMTIADGKFGLDLYSDVSLYQSYSSRSGNHTPVRVRFDNLAPFELNFYPGDNGSKWYFIPVEVADKLGSHSKLLLEVTAFNAGENVIEFDLAGARSAAAWAAGKCMKQSVATSR